MKIKCGFEWHVQIDSGKLFCRCESEIKENKDFKEIERYIRPSFGETGKIDASAEFEGQKMKTIVYKLFDDTDCLVDIDEEPPHEIDNKALSVGVEMSYALNSYLLKNLIFMRKTIADGSNTTGFQRTAVLALNGAFKFKDKTITIDTISLEEDSARKDSEDENKAVYFLDRIGIPLIEIATGIIETDENEAKEIAMEFGKFTRLFSVKRGIGTIRQDVNLSIEGGKRVELKGFQNIREMDKVILNEAERQKNLIKMKENFSYLIDNLSKDAYSVKEILSHSDSNLAINAIKEGKEIIGMKLKGFKGVLGSYLCEGKRFGAEISDYLKIKLNCGIIHSDELPAYGINDKIKAELAQKLNCDEKDAFLFSICPKGYEEKVIETAIERIKSLLTDVPSEVRLVKDDNTTKFLRPMGGKDRMYVETDLPIIKIENDVINEGKKYSEFTADSIRNSLNISEEQLDQLISARKLDEAIKIHNEIGADFLTIIQIAVENWKYIKRKFGMEIKQEIIKDIIKNVNSQNITKEGALVVMEEMALKNVDNVEKIINDKKLVKVNEKRLEEEINKLIHNGKIDKINSLILNLKDRLGPTFEAKDAYRIATEKIKNEKK
jgi:glutamyl-tRNA(Gln) amidotransferase subunit E